MSAASRLAMVGVAFSWVLAVPAPVAQTGAARLTRVGDVFSVSIGHEPELSRDTIVVRQDGKISFPLVGDVEAEGKTSRQLAQALALALARYIKDPVVCLQDPSGRQVTISVVSSGVFLKSGDVIHVP